MCYPLCSFPFVARKVTFYRQAYRPKRPHDVLPFRVGHHTQDRNGITLAMEGYRQGRNYACGFASTMMVLRYFQPAADPQYVYRLLGTDRTGTRQSAIVRVLREYGLCVRLRYNLTFAMVRRMIERNKLLISYLHKEEHWVVLYGYGRDPERVFMADPRPGVDEFSYAWSSMSKELRGFSIVCSAPNAKALVNPCNLAVQSPQLCFDFLQPASNS